MIQKVPVKHSHAKISNSVVSQQTVVVSATFQRSGLVSRSRIVHNATGLTIKLGKFGVSHAFQLGTVLHL